MERQLTFDLRRAPALGRADFIVTPANAEALAMLDAPDRWPQGRLMLIGPDGAGKSHAASFWAALHGAEVVDARALSAADADALIGEGGALVVEDCHRAGGAAGAEQALFHLWNLAYAREALLLMTARGAPRDWGLSLPDLRSRLEATAQARFGAPDEVLIAAVLVKLFADRQLSVAPDLIDWIALRLDRDLGAARRFVAALDDRAMAEGRAVSRRLAADLLDNPEAPDASSPPP